MIDVTAQALHDALDLQEVEHEVIGRIHRPVGMDEILEEEKHARHADADRWLRS